MKVSVCLALLALVGAYALTDAQQEALHEASAQCREQTGVSADTVRQLRDGVFVDRPEARLQVLCVSKKLALATAAGDIDLDVLRARLRRVARDEAEVDAIVRKCALKKATPEQTAFDAFRCLHESKPDFSPAE